MKIRQTVRHFAARKALELPVVGDYTHDKLVDLHTRVFLGWAEAGRAEERREHLDAFFDATVDAYLTALQEGYTEATAREITHVQANFEFYRRGWTEMMEFPGDEVAAHYERYADFFDRHGIGPDDPLGEFAPAGGLPDAPSTPEKLDDPEYPNATGGFADDVYVEDEAGEVRRGDRDDVATDEVDVSEAPGVSEDDVEA